MNAKVLSFKRNFSWTLLSSLFYAFSQWYIISSLAKLGDTEMVGIYSLGLAISAPIFLFLSMNIKVIMATEFQEENKFSEYLWFRLYNSTIAIGIILVICFLLTIPIENKLIISLVALVKWIESLSDICYGKFQQKENMKYIAVSKLYRSILSILVFTVVLWLYNSLLLAIFSQFITWTLVLIFYDLVRIKFNYRQKLFDPIINREKLKQLFVLAFPLGVASTLDSLHANIPRYFISYFEGEAALGIFTGITYIMIAGQTLVTALSQVAIPRLAKLYTSDIVVFKNFINKLLFVALFTGLFGFLISLGMGKQILLVLYNEEYSNYSYLLIMTMVASTFWYMSGFLNAGIIASKNFRVQVPIYVSAVAATLLASIFLIPLYSLTGAIVSLMLGYIVRFLFSIVVVRNSYKKKKVD